MHKMFFSAEPSTNSTITGWYLADLSKAQGKQERKPLLKDRDEEEVRGYRDALTKKRGITLKKGVIKRVTRRMAQSPDEKTYVKIPFIEQLKAMGWEHIKRLQVADCGRI